MNIPLLPLLLSFSLSAAAASRDLDPIERAFTRVDTMIDNAEYSRARVELDEAQALLDSSDPRVVRFHERTGAIRLREGVIDEARASFTSALKAAQRLKVSDENVAKSYAGLGLCLRREKKDKYALKFFKKALGLKLDEGTRMFVEDQISEIEGRRPWAAF